MERLQPLTSEAASGGGLPQKRLLRAMPACSTFPVFANTRPWGQCHLWGRGEEGTGRGILVLPLVHSGSLFAGMCPSSKVRRGPSVVSEAGLGSVGAWREVLAGAGLTWGTLPEAHGVAGRPLESRLQGLVSVPPGRREARALCAHLRGQRGW